MVINRAEMHAAEESLPELAALPESNGLPDPLLMRDGRSIAARAEWESARRPELRSLFQHYMYGQIPPSPQISVRPVDRDEHWLGDKATLKQVALGLGIPDCPEIHLLLVVPHRPAAAGGAPVFVALNFAGNHSLSADEQIELPGGWMPDGAGVVDHRATAAGRGLATSLWPLETIIDRGYALATFYYGDVMPDKPDFQGGVYPFFRQSNAPQRSPDEWGAIAAWAWGLSRAVDYVGTDADLDSRRIVLFGHSRNGKAALLAAAFDSRVAAVIAHQAGCGGSAPSRRHNPQSEPVARINQVFPHWFAERFHQFGGHENRLPFDQHCLIAMCAPRAVLLSNGEADQWADPAGQFEMLRAARPVYRLYGVDGLPDAVERPELDRLVGAELSYFLDRQPHVVNLAYWKVFCDFADRALQLSP